MIFRIFVIYIQIYPMIFYYYYVIRILIIRFALKLLDEKFNDGSKKSLENQESLTITEDSLSNGSGSRKFVSTWNDKFPKNSEKRKESHSGGRSLKRRFESLSVIESCFSPSKKKRSMSICVIEDSDESDLEIIEVVESDVKFVREEIIPRREAKEKERKIWKWWKENAVPNRIKWHFLEHKGPVFAPPYKPLPSKIKLIYDKVPIRLSLPAEEVASFYAKIMHHDISKKDTFKKNFFNDWRSVMTENERKKITDLEKCNFKNIHLYYSTINKNRKDVRKVSKNKEIEQIYGYCTIDGHREKIYNFKLEPPGLFRGRGEHPKMGKLKRRIEPEDIIINCSEDSKFPIPPIGHNWKEVRHDNTVSWLASWADSISNQMKYIILNPSSKVKGIRDWNKYEIARRLHEKISQIRTNYKNDLQSKYTKIRQRAVALFFIDRLALRAGHEKDEEQTDTVGCCSLRVEHIKLLENKHENKFIVQLDFLGKDSIRYLRTVSVPKDIFKNLELFVQCKQKEELLFDQLSSTEINKYLNELMEGLTAKVFRTYNASITLQQQLEDLTNENDSLDEKLLSYIRANRAAAILCNHHKSTPKSHKEAISKLNERIRALRLKIKRHEKKVKIRKSVSEHSNLETRQLTLQKLRHKLMKVNIKKTVKQENKTLALETSKLNYLDPRITVAWCKKYNVPIDKVFNKSQRDKFQWAIDTTEADYRF